MLSYRSSSVFSQSISSYSHSGSLFVNLSLSLRFPGSSQLCFDLATPGSHATHQSSSLQFLPSLPDPFAPLFVSVLHAGFAGSAQSSHVSSTSSTWGCLVQACSWIQLHNQTWGIFSFHCKVMLCFLLVSGIIYCDLRFYCNKMQYCKCFFIFLPNIVSFNLIRLFFFSLKTHLWYTFEWSRIDEKFSGTELSIQKYWYHLGVLSDQYSHVKFDTLVSHSLVKF